MRAIIIFLYLINFSFLRAEIVNEIIIDGNVRVSNKTVFFMVK